MNLPRDRTAFRLQLRFSNMTKGNYTILFIAMQSLWHFVLFLTKNHYFGINKFILLVEERKIISNYSL